MRGPAAYDCAYPSRIHLPYVFTLLLFCTCIASINTQGYEETRRFGTSQRLNPAPVYPDAAEYVDNSQYPDYVAPVQNSWSIAHQPQMNVNAAINKLNYTPVSVPGWPDSHTKLGQVSAVSIDCSGHVVVFHRASRTWNPSTFTNDNRYWNTNEQPIALPTIAVLNSSTGQLIDQWGQNMFFMPHGLTVDSKNNVWVTDVALHQVMKFPSGEKETPSLTLGVRFTPGNDNHHFCKPTGVAVMESGDFFVSDGYCNARVIKYSAAGKRILQWGRNSFHGVAQVVAKPYSFAIPHALVLAEDKGLLCAADRENGRVQCFNCSDGTFVIQFHSPVIGSRLFSVAYSPKKGGQLYVVNGPDYTSRPIRGFVIDIATKKILSQFGPNNKDFSNPHDIAISKDGKEIYVVELEPYKIHKFVEPNVEPVKVNEVSKPTPKSVEESNLNKSSANANASTIAPVKPTATVEGLSLVSTSWAGWAGVAGGVAGGLGAVLLLLLGGAALLLRARHRGGTPLLPEKESLVL
ncbi:peptidyl-alpha-hydroxyglycine-alpha-amidating lyase 1 [Arctopsyche grandis]|uniref:peptidyl-alpha-hydroxyglycine-alpha-amidating lyase 1 n=1 Tax=Arctopsyche grandis TaxID=121162 RepID=UPI00406D65B2